MTSLGGSQETVIAHEQVKHVQSANLSTLLKGGLTKPSFLLVEKEVGPIKINSTYTKKCIDPIKVILFTNKNDDSTNKNEGFINPSLRRVDKIELSMCMLGRLVK